MSPKFSEQIAKDEVFSHLSARDHEELARLAFHTSYKKGQYICMQDDIWNRALYISSGKLGWVMLAPDGKRQVVFRMGPGRIVWGHSLFDGELMPAALEVMEDCEACIWEGEAIMPIISRNVDAVWTIARKPVGTMRKGRDVVYGFAFHPVAGRLAHLLPITINLLKGGRLRVISLSMKQHKPSAPRVSWSAKPSINLQVKG